MANGRQHHPEEAGIDRGSSVEVQFSTNSAHFFESLIPDGLPTHESLQLLAPHKPNEGRIVHLRNMLDVALRISP